MSWDTGTPAVSEWGPGSASAGLLASGRKKSCTEWWNKENAVEWRWMLMLKDTERKNIQLTYQSFNKQFSCYWCRFRDYEEWTSSDIHLCFWVRYFLLPWPWLFLFQFEKAHFHIMRNLLHLRVFIVSSWRDCFEKDWSLLCVFVGLLREARDCLCECAHGHTVIRPPGEAESLECSGMPSLDRSSVLLQTGELCTLNTTHGFTLSIQRKYRLSVADACSHFHSPLQ